MKLHWYRKIIKLGKLPKEKSDRPPRIDEIGQSSINVFFKSRDCQSLHELKNEIRQIARDSHKRSRFEGNADDYIYI